MNNSSAAGAASFDSEHAPLSVADIQARLDGLAVAMAAKGLREPCAEFCIKSNMGGHAWLTWRSEKKDIFDGHKMLPGNTEKALADADAWVAALPTPEQARLTAFLASLDETIHLGKKADIDVEHINPMLEIFKRISKNAITHQVQA